MDLRQVFKRYGNVFESFTRKIRSKKNDELTSKADTAFVPDGVYILHETLGVRTVDGWNPKNNNGVVGILLVEDDHKIVVALEDAPENLPWSSEYGLINQPVDFDEEEDAQNDFNGEYYCQKLDSPKFPAAYYCKTYNKGGRSWYLPSSGELRLICNHFKEIQNALSIVGGQKLVATWGKDVPEYLSSTESSPGTVWALDFSDDYLDGYDKVSDIGKVRPVSKFGPSNTLKESFTRKIRSKKNDELTTKADTAFVPDGVYILHETLGVKGVEGWNPKNNNGVVGILLIEDDHKIVVATEDAPENLTWSEKRGLINEPIEKKKDAQNDFNGEYYCRKLNSPNYPVEYYCKTYNKGGRSWYLPSSGELRLIYKHLDEIQNALSIVEGQKLVTTWAEGAPVYWSSTERGAEHAWYLNLRSGSLDCWGSKVGGIGKVRPVSKFDFSTLKESFIKKVSSKKTTDLVPDLHYPDGVYIFHRTLGVKTVEEWNKDDNNGVIGILVAEDGHEFVVGLKDAAQVFQWSKNYGLVNEPIEDIEDAKTDFNGKDYYWSLNSIDFPASYYLPWGEDDRRWYLPSAGEMYTIYRNFNDVQNALSVVGGQKLITSQNRGQYGYWTSTEYSNTSAWYMLYLDKGRLSKWGNKVSDKYRVRPVAKFEPLKLKESFTKKISRKKNNELISKSDTTFLPDGVYILHDTLGVRTVDSWNPKDNEGVVGILLIEDDHKIVVATKDAPKYLTWSEKRKLINQPVDEFEDAESDFNGEMYCRKFNSPNYPAAYYCKTYNKGNRSWYLPSLGELRLIYNHLEEIQNALSIVGGQKFITSFNDGDILSYLSSTEYSGSAVWYMHFVYGACVSDKDVIYKVRPVSKFNFSTLKESFTKKISRKKNNELISKTGVETFIPEGVYILHDTLGVRDVEGWNPRNNYGVVGVLVVEDDHKIVVALEDSPKVLPWSNERGLINEPIKKKEDVESDFNGEYYCQKLDSPDFPAAYYCLNYKKGGRNWYLPSTGELWLIYRHLDEIQNALSIFGGQKLITTWDEGVPEYWSSTESRAESAWELTLHSGNLRYRHDKVSHSCKVRPVSKFNLSELKESFTKKISKKNGTEVIGRSERIFLEESIAQIVFSFGKNAMVPNKDKKLKFGYKLPFGCLPNFFNSNKILDNGDVIKRTKTRSFLGYTQTYEIIAVDIYFASLSKKVYVGMEKPSSLSQSESFPKIYNLYGASSSGILELSDFSVDELRRILRNLQERTKFKKPLRKKIILKGEESF